MALKTDSEVAIGIDVGGTKIAAGLVTRSGELFDRTLFPTGPERGGEVVLRDVERLAHELARRARAARLNLCGIGVGVAELIDLKGEVTSDFTIKWRGLPVRERLARIAPARLEADVRAAALAEARLGAGKDYEIFLYLTVGTGISSCLVQYGRPYAGAHGGALVCASSPLTHRCPACGAESRPVLEEYASGPALARRFQDCTRETITGAEKVFHAAAAGDERAREILLTAGAALGTTTGLLINVLDPQAIIVGGGLGLAGGLYWDSFMSATRAHTWADAARRIPIRTAALADAGLLGAGLNVWREDLFIQESDKR